MKTVRRLPEACDCSEASSTSKAFLTSFEYLLKFWHHLSGTSSQSTCHGSFQSQIAFVPWHYHLFEAKCVCVCACLFSSLKWLLLSVLWMHSAKVRCILLPIKYSHGLTNTLVLLMMGNRERLNTLNLMACSMASIPFPMCILAHGTGTLCSCCHYRFGARPGWDPIVKSAICTSELC